MIIRRPEDIGALVRDRRRAARLSQTDLAHSLGVSQRYISHLESGKSTLQLGLVLRVLDTLGVTLTIAAPSAVTAPTRGPRKRSPISIDSIVDG